MSKNIKGATGPSSAYWHNQSIYQQAAVQQQIMMNAYTAAYQPKPYRFNGRDMDAEEFANTIYPVDCAERTHLLLKMKGNNE